MKNLIDSLGITHRRFAELYGIPYNTVSQWYRGKRTAPEWVKSLIEQIIENKKQGEQLNIKDEIIFCNVTERKDQNGKLKTWKTYFTEEEKANEERNYFEDFNKKHPEQKFTLERRKYIRIN